METWVRVDKNVFVLYIFFGATWVHRVWAHTPLWDTGYVMCYMAVHLILYFMARGMHPWYIKHRHTIVTTDRFFASLTMLQGQWRQIHVCAIDGDWGSVLTFVMGMGSGSQLLWHAALHPLPFNRALFMLLLQFCVQIGTNGQFVQPMQREFGDKLTGTADKINAAGSAVLGNYWPPISGTAYFAVLFLGTRQVAWFFATMWFLYRVEREHRLKFLKRHGIEPETCGFSQATRFDFSFLIVNVLVVTAAMSHDLLVLYDYHGLGGKLYPSLLLHINGTRPVLPGFHTTATTATVA
eukprot:CAMPEP_0206144936 /NCGR_PEP_ID=MMETSP1473-20131121/25910_1 /ASSEMBLY_ACC=CAM_ASM_001109 /TAXON_ID=1461547 /ORGANISM="Stichococcus sp, Strain RCC1054" /LENGTH=294 /DNA_ID=CAMNT_0053540963 /DNA_START=327 /DNA_END=1211 /DNA_ORIENTATION=-